MEEKQPEVLHDVNGEVLTEAEVEKRARVEVEKALDSRITEYEGLVPEFDDMLDSYKTLIKLVKEHKDEFKPSRHGMILDQFEAVTDSYKTQRKNFLKELKKYKKLKSSVAMHSTADLIKRLELAPNARKN